MAKKIKQSTRQTRRDDSETKQAKVKERAATSRAVPVSHAGKSEEAKNTRKAAVKHLSTAPAKSHLTSPVQKSATRSSQSLQTQAVHANALMANLQDSESCPPNNLIISVDDASGPRYRKIALNGRPMPDEQPHHKEETDREKEETFVDALTLGLRHSTTDIHIPLVGGELALEARRDVHSEVWSLRSGLRPDERPDLPFGTCWSSNLTPNLHIVYQFETDNPCPQYDPVYAYATDENGSTHRFVRLDSTTGRHYFPMPNARTEQETFLMTLQVDSQGRFVLTKKHGTTLIYEALPHIEIPLAMDRFQGSGTELHTYYRLISIQDRFGTTIEYHYPTNLTEEQRTLIPGEIVFKDVPPGSGQTIFGTGTGGGGSSSIFGGGTSQGRGDQKLTVGVSFSDHAYGLVTSISDPMGHTYDFTYATVPYPGALASLYPPCKALSTVAAPANSQGVRPQTHYGYQGVDEEPDYNPVFSSSGPTPQYHMDIASITDPLGNEYDFTYAIDTGKIKYDATHGVYYPANGQPRNVATVVLPDVITPPDPSIPEAQRPPPVRTTTTFKNISSVKLLLGGNQFDGYRITQVFDVMGNSRVYHFEGNDVFFMNDFQSLFGASDIRTPKIVYYTKMTIFHYQGVGPTFPAVDNPNRDEQCKAFSGTGTGLLGREVFEFDVNAGMALAKVSDFQLVVPGGQLMVLGTEPMFQGTPNVTEYKHEDAWDLTQYFPNLPSVAYIFGKYADPTKQINAVGKAKQFAYEPKWRLMAWSRDEENRSTCYDFDTLGRRTSEKVTSEAWSEIGIQVVGAPPPPRYVVPSNVPWDQITTFDYENSSYHGFMTRKTVVQNSVNDPSWATNLKTEYVADDYGRVKQEIVDPDDLRLVTSYEHDLNNNKTSTTDPRGNTTTFGYDNQNRLIQVQYPATGDPAVAATKQFGYDLRGNKIKETDENGHITLFAFDIRSRLVTQTRIMSDDGTPDSTQDLITSHTYNDANAKTSVTDPNGNVTHMYYDALQRLVKTTDALNQDTTFEYETNSGASTFDVSLFKPTRTIDPRGHRTEIDYDAVYRPVVKRFTYSLDPLLVATTQMTYDGVGNVVQEIDPLDRVTTKQYDSLNRLVLVTFPYDANSETAPTYQTLYTSTGLKWKTIDELGRATETRYDTAGRANKVIGPMVDDGSGTTVQPVTQTIHDENGNVVGTINPLGNRWDYAFDERNRKVTEWQPAVRDGETGQTVRPALQWQYDAVGNAVAHADARGNTTNSTYDNVNRVIKVQAPPVASDTSYPPVYTDRPTTLTEYDKNGNVVKVTDPNGHATTNAYDALNRLVQTTDAEGIIVENTYDEVGNRTKVEDGNGQATEFAYDGLNRNTLVKDPAEATTLFAYDAVNKTARTDSLSQVTQYAYDLRNRLASVSYTGRSDDNRTYAYDAVGNLLSVTETGHGNKADVAYTYDNLNRVVSETSGGVSHQYSYDLVGNRLRTVYGNGGRTLVSTYDVLNRLSTLTESGRTTHYAYDLNGNITGKNMPNGETIGMTHDALNRVREMAAPGYTYYHSYDLVGNVIQIIETYPNNPSLNRTVVNEYDKINRLISETIHGEDTTSADEHALRFDGQQNRVVVPNSSALFPSPLTVECWVKMCGDPHANWLWFMGNRDGEGSGGYMFGDASSGTKFYVGNSSCDNGSIQDGQWHHLAGVWDGGHIQLFVDGVGGNRVGCSSINNNGYDLLMGACPTSDAYEKCYIKAVRISNVARYASTFSPPEVFVTDAHCVANYTFSEGMGSILHDTANSHDGQLQGTPMPLWSTTAEPALQFNGQNYVEVPQSSDWTPQSAVTLECWYRSTAGAQWENNGVVGNYDNGPGMSGGCFLDQLWNGYRFCINSSDGWHHIGSSSVNLDDGKWHHWAGVWDGTTAYCFADGQLIGQASVPNILVSNIPFRMGWVGQGVNGHACSLRSVRLSNVALYTSAFTPEWDYTLHPSTTIAWWKLNEGNGTTVSDSVNNHNGTLVGSPLPGWE